MLKLEELDVYRMAMEIGERVWAIADGWNFFAKDTVGKQLVRAADSIAANIAEGYGRYHYKENKLFCYYTRGSLMETKTWLQKATHRGFISDQDLDGIATELDILHFKLNAYIKSIGQRPNDH